MSNVAEITKLAGVIAAKWPILKGIATTAEHQQALALMDELLENYDANLVVIEALSNAIARYENGSVRYEIFNKRNSELDPALATLKVLMDQGGLHATDFENEIGKESSVTKVLAGKKNLTKDHITKLAERFGLPTAILVAVHSD